ncbi:MAG TPA: hypothetical protein VLC49_02495 [Solirubrobacteraceae bacterium]|nr:hypothetical protein [Solirubrobacteraceae bacterium]
MNAIPYDRPEEEWDSLEDVALPGRPRRKVLTWWSAGLFALILCAVGFYAGVRVEKNQLSNSTPTSAFSAAAAARSGAAGRTGAAGGAFRGVFGGAGAGGSATFGTVSSVSGHSLFVTDASGNTVKVTLSNATKVTKNVNVGKKAVRPGDLVVVSGAKGSNGTISATTVSDTGSSPAAAAGGGSRSSGAGSSGSAAVNQLFGGG